ncbi:MAG: hypothetical protein A2Y17_08905 [Clostridiales bacterium GWF2_38_85]|nr:MAG: hypothetical protein A2Y17_08905 [Clostridiales bacterium GWF2_38_85]HBL83685.1 hypothetical protein [Clostridiales bacterium]
MSVVKQKLATVSGNMDSLEAAVLYCASFRIFYPDEPPRSIGNFKRYTSPGELNPYANLKNKAKILLENIDKSLLPNDNKKTECKMPIYADAKQYSEYLETKENKLNELSSICESLQKKLIENRVIIEQLGHLKSINIPLRDLYEFEYIKIRFGYLPRENYERFEVYIGSIRSAIFLPSSIEKDSVWGMYFTIRGASAENDTIFTTLGFKRVHLPNKADEIPSESIHELQVETTQLQNKYTEAKKQLHDYALSVYSELLECEEYLSMLSKSFDIKKKVLLVGEETYAFYGWISNSILKELKEKLKKIGADLTIEEYEASDISEPPVILKNFVLFKPFQEFVEMYGLPSYREFDPTPFVAITYALFFGMMFGDIGQGALLILFGYLVKKFLKMNIGSILLIVGVSSIGFGFVYGSVFGYEHWLGGFKPSENTNTILLYAVGIGVIMITICSLFNIINGIKQKRIDKYLLSPNGIVGLVFYWSILLFALEMIGVLQLPIPKIVLEVSLLITGILLFAKEPLIKLFEGKKEKRTENIFEMFVANFFELFEICLSYITNTISFIRIGAFAISHASMMAVVYMLAEQPSGGYNIIAIIVGNLLVMALEGLVVGIQVLRLEFYELFSRFYDGNGRNVE